MSCGQPFRKPFHREINIKTCPFALISFRARIKCCTRNTVVIPSDNVRKPWSRMTLICIFAVRKLRHLANKEAPGTFTGKKSISVNTLNLSCSTTVSKISFSVGWTRQGQCRNQCLQVLDAGEPRSAYTLRPEWEDRLKAKMAVMNCILVISEYISFINST